MKQKYWKIIYIASFASLLTGCDNFYQDARAKCEPLASSPHETVNYVGGVEFSKINTLFAQGPCSEAARSFFSGPVDWYRYGRVLLADKDYAESKIWTEMAAEKNYAAAQGQFGYMYISGKGVTKNYELGREWLLKAAEQNDANAQFNLAVSYYTGQGVAKDYKIARSWYRKSAALGYAQSQYNLGLMNEHGTGGEKNITKAFAWFTKAANQGHDGALYVMAVKYYKGIGVIRDEPKAIEMFKKAKQAGNKDAAETLLQISRADKKISKQENNQSAQCAQARFKQALAAVGAGSLFYDYPGTVTSLAVCAGIAANQPKDNQLATFTLCGGTVCLFGGVDNCVDIAGRAAQAYFKAEEANSLVQSEGCE